MRQLILELMPATPPRLDNYVPGGNGETLSALTAWLGGRTRAPALLLWGESGAGKTHLLRASGADYRDAALDPDLAELEDMHPAAGALYAVDNVQAASARGQISLFNLFNRLIADQGRLLAAADQPPLALRLREDLRTRLGSGLVYRLHPLTDEEKVDALAAQAAGRGLRLPREALDYLLARAPRDMRSLSALIVALDRYSLEHKRPITLPLLRDVLLAPSL